MIQINMEYEIWSSFQYTIIYLGQIQIHNMGAYRLVISAYKYNHESCKKLMILILKWYSNGFIIMVIGL